MGLDPSHQTHPYRPARLPRLPIWVWVVKPIELMNKDAYLIEVVARLTGVELTGEQLTGEHV